ncbi:MAG: hypothetical protein V4615_10210 [Bacteroidota bacterium]
MAITVLENYVSIDEYAALCGISRRSVLNRIRAATISAIKVDEIYAVNTQTSPPRSYINHAWKKPGGGAHHSYPDLKAVIPWCNRKDMRCYPYLRAIIAGKMDGWVIAGEVFAKAADLQAFKK